MNIIEMIRNLIKWAFVTNIDKDTSQFPQAQISYQGKVKDTVTYYPYGHTANAPLDNLGILVTIGNPDNTIFFPLSEDNRCKGLKEGETAFGNFKVGSHVKFLENGNVEITSIGDVIATVGGDITATATGSATVTASSITINGPTTINGTLTVTGATSLNSTLGVTGATTTTTISATAVTASSLTVGAAVMSGGNISTTGAITANGVDLETHDHPVTTAPGTTGPPN